MARIIRSLLVHPSITEVLIWNNNKDELLSPGCHDRVKVVNSSWDTGLFSRFSLALLAQNEIIWNQDDDWEVPARVFEEMLQGFRQSPDRVHGIFGRDPTCTNTYALEYQTEQRDCDMVMTCACFYARQLVPHVFAWQNLPLFRNYYLWAADQTHLPSNGEDILLSYVAMSLSKKQNRCYGLPLVELDDAHAISRQPNHRKIRTELMQRCRSHLCLT